jgi:hypothetical protein
LLLAIRARRRAEELAATGLVCGDAGADPGGLEGPAETLLSPGGGGVLAGGLLPAPPGGGRVPIKTLERGVETAELLAESSSFGGDQARRPVLGSRGGGGSGGQVATGLAAFLPPAGASGMLELAESCAGTSRLARGVTDRACPVGAGGLGEFGEALAGLA